MTTATKDTAEKPMTYPDMASQTGFTINYTPDEYGGASIQAVSNVGGETMLEMALSEDRLDEAHILYMEVTELLRSRAKISQDHAKIRTAVSKLFALFRGENVSFDDDAAAVRQPSSEFVANPGKKIEIDVDSITYERLPVRTRVITTKDADIVPIIESYVKPYLKSGDAVYVSEKALTITHGRIVSMSDVKPTPLARLLARNIGNYYGTSDFHGFGHGTAIAMEAFISEAGYPRAVFAAAVAAVTRPLGIKGMFYRICGKQAKSVDCPMSFLILEYAHSVKLAPKDPDGEARRIKKALGDHEVVILDSNYRGAFSLGKTSGAPSEEFIGELFADNPLGQSDEMTPFCIVRKK